MTVTPIPSPLAGEHVLAVAPTMAYPSVDAGWLRHLRLFTGRALDDVALTGEQDGRAGRLAVLGQTLAPGIVTGLDVAHETSTDGEFFHVTSGIGLLPSGEDVVLGRDLRIARAALGGIDPKLLAAVLVLVPTIVPVAGRFDPDDPCAIDDSEDAFADEQRVDGVQVELVPWQPAWKALDAAAAGRNALAYTIFELERALAFGEIPPWQQRGVPLALIGFDGTGKVAFVDRHAIARTGGHAPPRAPLVAEAARAAGTVSLWQARILQLADHLADARSAAGALPTALAAPLATLPPAGVIPRDAVDLTQPLTNHFFPPSWRLRAVPIPSEQLDGVLARAAGLAPLATSASQEIVVLAPVPQAVYEPGLLQVETVDPEFQTTIDGLVTERTDELGRRQYLRERRDALIAAGDPTQVAPYPTPDPGALEPEGTIVDVSTNELAYDTQLDGTTVRASALVALAGRLVGNAALTDAQRAALEPGGLVAFIATLQQLAATADDAIDFGFLSTQTDIYRMRQLVLGTDLASKLTTSPVLATIAKGDTAAAVKDNILSFLTTLKTPAAPAKAAAPEPAAALTVTSKIVKSTAFTHTIQLEPTASVDRVVTAAGRPLAAGPTAPLSIKLTPTGITTPVKKVTTPPSVNLITDTGATLVSTGGGTGLDLVREAAPVIGAIDVRNVTTGERIEAPASSEARNYALSTRQDGITAFSQLETAGLAVSDLQVYGVLQSRDATSGDATRVAQAWTDAKKVDFINEAPPGTGVAESAYFNDTVGILEGHIATLRGLEGRVAQLRAIIADCQNVLASVRASQRAVDARLAQVQDELTDRRGAVATARALLAEEQARVDRLNARRAAVLAQHVQVLAYVRPRFFDGLTDVPELSLDPALLESPVPACLAGHDDAPAEISQMLALLREAPMSWLVASRPIISILDRVDLMQGLAITARTRALAVAETGFATPFAATDLTGPFGPLISSIGRGQVDAIWQPRAQVASLDLRNFVGLSWTESRDATLEVASLGDVIEGNHGKVGAVAGANAELGQIEKIAGCLWSQVGQVLPAIRLGWATALDQAGAGHTLDALTTLPRWNDVPYTTRKSIELLGAWLVARVISTVGPAVAWMKDLIRVCILLASHAPVNQIIAGDLPQTSPAGPGHLVHVTIDPTIVKIGMRATFHQSAAVVAQGVVEDLVGQTAKVRVADATAPDLRVDPVATRVRFAVAGSAAAPLTRELA